MFEVNFFRTVLCWIILCALVGGGIITSISPGVQYVDGLFLAISALSGTGLWSVEARAVSSGGLITVYILMFLGGTCILLLPPMIYRQYAYSRIRPQLLEFLEDEVQLAQQRSKTAIDAGFRDCIEDEPRPLAKALVEAITQSELLHRAIGMTILAIMIHNFFWLFIGTFVMYGIATQYEDPQELQARGFSKLWANSFLTASSFFNCGFTLTSDSMFQYTQKHGIYIWSSFLILAGLYG
jgi:Trk-type K+ transport system membrane component